VAQRAYGKAIGPSALDTAVELRDQNILKMVEEAVQHREVHLAY
jgi:hypothetical protein